MGNPDTLTEIEPVYVFVVEGGHDGHTSLVNVHADTERAARLKAINETAGPVLIVELVEIIEPTADRSSASKP
jgi:hypothetical protein